MEIKHLGHDIGNSSIQTDPEKVEAIREFPLPDQLGNGWDGIISLHN